MLVGDALFSKTRQKMLGLLFGKPDKSFYTNELVRLASMGNGTVQRELDRLVASGIATCSKVGNQKFYQANIESPIFAELVGIVSKTFGIVDLIAEALISYGDNLEFAFVYGSVAKGSKHQNSDVDLLLVGYSLEYGDIIEMLSPLEAELGRPINPTIYSPEDFEQRLNDGQSFVSRLMEQPKLMVKGITNDFRKSSKNQETPQGDFRPT